MLVEIPSKFYNGNILLSKKDIAGKTPTMFFTMGNRSAGKTTYFLLDMLSSFKENGEEFVLLYRKRYETTGAVKLFDDILQQYPVFGKEIIDKPIADGLIRELYLDGKKMAYALSIGNPDTLKKYSPIFSKVTKGLFDECLLEYGKYLPSEIEKFIAVAISIGRGGGSQSRNITWYMLGNKTSLMNPWFISLGVHKRLRNDTKFLRGNGWVLEVNLNLSAQAAIKNNDISRIFEGNKQLSYAIGDDYLLDATCFIEKPKGKMKYLFTIFYGNKTYGVREVQNSGIIYINKHADPSSHFKMSFLPGDHNQNNIMLNKSCFIFHAVREAYFSSMLRFDDLETKNMIIDLLAVDLYK